MSEVLLRELINSDIDWIIATGRQQEIAAGTVLIPAGEAADYLHILLDGILTLTTFQPDNNPLNLAFAAIEGNETSGREIGRLFSGEIVGDIPFVSTHSTLTAAQAVEKSLVISIPQQELGVKLQQDVGFASRFYRAIAIILADRIQTTINKLTRSSTVQGQPLRDVLVILGELHDSDIDWMIACGKQKIIPANSILIHEKGPVDALSIILDGTMSLFVALDVQNPLTRAFAAIEDEEIPVREIAKLSKGQIIGENLFIDGRLPVASIKAIEETFILSIPRQQMLSKLQQDIGFASRFYRVIATLLSQRLEAMVSQLSYGRRVYSKGLPLAENVEYADELNSTVLDRMAFAGKRFDWMLEQLKKVSV